MLLGAYILLIGPINYLVLRRLDRREWAWVTMPVLIVVFAVGAYGFGIAAARQRRHRQRGRHRPRRAGRDRGSRPGLPRRLLADPRHVPGPRPGRRAAVVADQRRLLRRRHDARRLDVLQGDPGARPRPRRRVRLAADDPRRDRGHRPARPGRPAARGRPAAGHGHECLDRDAPEHRPSCSAAPWPSSTTSRRAPGATVDVALQPVQFGQQLSDKIVGQVFFGDPRQGERDRPPVRAPHDHRPADVRPELRLHRPAAGRRRGRPGLGRPRAPAGRDRGPEAAPDRQRPVVPADRRSRSAARRPSAPTCCATRSSRATRRSSTRTRSPSASGAGTAELSYRPIGFEGTLDGHRAGASASTSATGLRASSPSRSSRSTTIPRRACDAAGRRAASSPRSTACRRSSCTT